MRNTAFVASFSLIGTPLFVAGGLFLLVVSALQDLGPLQGAEVARKGPPPSEFELWAGGKLEDAIKLGAKAVQFPVPNLASAGSGSALFGGLVVNGIFWSISLCLVGLSLASAIGRIGKRIRAHRG